MNVENNRFTDTPEDPYTVTKGLWYAHIGWLVLVNHFVAQYVNTRMV
jgi:stearoyl-CoA desaturase (delta-9 desaturase)